MITERECKHEGETDNKDPGGGDEREHGTECLRPPPMWFTRSRHMVFWSHLLV